ncbi:hypothetical protein Ancab_005342 [Ancistrocladus abbreviatus]
MGDQHETSLQIAMYPWFAMGHINPFLHLSNKLAERGHKISFLLPPKIQQKLKPLNLHPDLITFIPIPIPNIDGLPEGAETTFYAPLSLVGRIMTAMDLTRHTVEVILSKLKPHIIFFDFVHWLPSIACRLGIKSVFYCTFSPATVGFFFGQRECDQAGKQQTWEDFIWAPLDFPLLSIKLHAHEAREIFAERHAPFGSGVSFYDRMWNSYQGADVICFRTCREIDCPYCDYVEKLFTKPVILTGPVLPEPPTTEMDEEINHWLRKFDTGSVIYYALGSECILKKDQFMELLLGLELIGLPFFSALKAPVNYEVIDYALPEGFAQRTNGRAIVHGEYGEQVSIGAAASIRGSIHQCKGDGWGFEGWGGGRKSKEYGLFTKETICMAVKAMVEADSQVGREVKANHAKWREFLLGDGLERSCIDNLGHDLRCWLG